MSQLKQIPRFQNENEEREFWATHDFTDYFDMSQALINPVFPNLNASTRTVHPFTRTANKAALKGPWPTKGTYLISLWLKFSYQRRLKRNSGATCLK